MIFIRTFCALGLLAIAGGAVADGSNSVDKAVANKVPCHWLCASANVELREGGAASGRQFVRIEDGSRIHQEIDQPADFRDSLRIRAKVRGKGVLDIYVYCYERTSRKNIPSILIKSAKIDALEWIPVEATYKCADDRILRLAFHANGGALDLDDVSITPE